MTTLCINTVDTGMTRIKRNKCILTCSLECNGVQGVSSPLITEDVCYHDLKCK